MPDVDATDRALRPFIEAAAELAKSASQAADDARTGEDAATTIAAARVAVERLRDQAHGVLDRLDDAGTQLSVLEEAARTARSLDPVRWPERRDAIAARLAANPLDGAADWLAAWARAFLFGCPAEAERLIAGPFALPPEAGWCPDRLGTVPDALSARSVQRLAPVLRYLAAGARLGDKAALPEDLRAHALILHARLLVQAGLPGAADLLAQASTADHHHEAEVLAVRAAMARLSPEPGDAAQAEATAALARQAWKAERCAATAVEVFHAERRGTGGQAALDDARALVEELPAVADPEGALDVLVLPVPDEIWLAAGERAARERDFAAARKLAGRISSGAGPLLAAEAADLRVRIAKDAGEEPAALAGQLAAAGVANAIAGRAPHAIEQYTEALGLVPGHQDATLGLADALLVDGWGKPLREEADQFRRAVAMLDESYASQPLQAPTSWSLMTYSYLASALANQAAAAARARSLWLAPIAAARALAFDPSQPARWVRLAETLIDVNCLEAAEVVSSHATKLAPGDPLAMRNRIATLTNLGHVEAALALLDQAVPDSGDGWFSAVRAIALQIASRGTSGQAAAELLDKALSAANEAVRIDTPNLWYHLVRADLLVRTGKEGQAGEDFEYLWRDSQLDQVDGLGFATRAAIGLQLGSDAVALSTQALDLAAATAGDYSERFNQGAALLLDGNPTGLPCLDHAMRLAMNPYAIDYLRARLDNLTEVLRHAGNAPGLGDVARALDARAAEIAADTSPVGARIDAELDRVTRNEHYEPEVAELAAFAAALTRAWCGLALGAPDALGLLDGLAQEHPEYPELASAAQALTAAPLPGLEAAAGQAAPAPPAPSEQVLETHVPGSWFAGLAEPLDHEIIKRFVPDARARLRRRTGAVLPGVNFRDDSRLEPAGFRILLHGTVVAEGQLRPGRWCCPAPFTAALSAQIRAQLTGAPEAAGPEPFPVLESFPAPADPDPLTALVAWPPAEVVARRIELAYATWLATQPAAGPT